LIIACEQIGLSRDAHQFTGRVRKKRTRLFAVVQQATKHLSGESRNEAMAFRAANAAGRTRLV